MVNIFTKDFWRFGSTTSVAKNSTETSLRSVGWSTVPDNIDALSKAFGINLSGINVTAENALSIPAVLACLEIRNNSIASVPLRVHKDVANGSVVDDNHPLDYLLNVRPNRYQTPFIFRRTLGYHADIWGMGIAAIERDTYRNAVSFRILHRDKYLIYETVGFAADFDYFIVEEDGKVWREEDLIIWRGISTDGFHCRGIVGCATTVIKTGLTTREFMNKYYENGTFIGGILTTENTLKPEEAEKNKKSWQSRNSGVSNAGGTAVLTNGLKFQPLTNTLVDSQLVEFLQLDKSEIYQAFSVPPHLVGDTTKSTSFGSGIESQTIGFYTLTLMPRVVNLEQEITYKALRTSEQRNRRVKHNWDAFLRADSKSQMETFAKGIEKGIYSPNDCLKLMDMQTYEGGDVKMVNGTMIPVDMVGKQYNTNSNGTGTQDTPVE